MKKYMFLVALLGLGLGMVPQAKAGVAPPTPTPPVGGGGGGGSLIPDVSAQSGHRNLSGWGSINGTGLVVDEMSGSAQIYPDNNPNDDVIARFSVSINMSGNFADNPGDFPDDSRGPSVNGRASIDEYSLVHSDKGWDYIQGVPSFSIGYNANTTYYISSNQGKPGEIQSPKLWTNIYSNFDVLGGQITSSWSNFSQNFWSGGEPMPDWFTLSDWNGSMEVSGVIVPEPATLALLGLGGSSLLFRQKKNRVHNRIA